MRWAAAARAAAALLPRARHPPALLPPPRAALRRALLQNRILKSPVVAHAFRCVDRGAFMMSCAGRRQRPPPPPPVPRPACTRARVLRRPPQVEAKDAYLDRPSPIGYGQTISAPHMHAAAAEKLLERFQGRAAEPLRVLDVGSGSGFLTAVLAFALPHAFVIGVDVIPGLVSQSLANFNKSPATAALIASGRVRFHAGDGWAGYPPAAPFDLIHVGAAAETLPAALVAQLRPGGRLVCPVGVYSQQLVCVDKGADGGVVQRDVMPVVFVPLVRTTAG